MRGSKRIGEGQGIGVISTLTGGIRVLRKENKDTWEGMDM